MASFEQKVQSICEMFPNHRRDTIEGILREMNGNEDNAISILLDTPENAPPPPPPGAPAQHAHPQYQAQPPRQQYPGNYPAPQGNYRNPQPYPAQGNQYMAPNQYGGIPQPYGMPQQYAPPQPKPAHQQPQRTSSTPLPKFDHIFSNDFLRWPDDAQVIKVNRDGVPIGPPPPAQPMAPNANYPPPSYPGAAPSYPAPGYAPSYPGIAIPACDPNDDLPPPSNGHLPQIDINSDLIPDVDKGKDSTSWWENFKARFKKKKDTAYESIN